MAFKSPQWMPQDDNASAVEREAAILRFWKDRDIFHKSLKASEGGEPFVFYEGPPTANGRPHPGHVLTRVMKDVFPRYHTMNGRYVPRKAGWDTHGLPVEIEVEKELGLSSKEDIEKYGVEPFVKKCMASVFRYTKEWEELTDRIGFWIDLSEAYVTYHRSYVESVWWAVGELWKKGLLYQGHKIVPWCVRCGTGLSSHEVGWGYKTVQDPSVYVKFRVTKDANGKQPEKPTYLIAWTTTPWTLVSNAALAVRPDAEYAFLDGAQIQRDEIPNDEVWILAADRVCPAVFNAPSTGRDWDGTISASRYVRGSELVEWHYEPLYEAHGLDKPAYRVVGADFVTMEDGTGIVHIAPAFGADDQAVGRAKDLPTIVRTDERGLMTEDTPFAGKWVKDADKEIIRDLRERGLLLRHESFSHEYPHCWRCDTPLLYYPRAGWFIRTTQFKERMMELNRSINWVPEHIKEGRFGNFLRDNIDWALSRERYWGTPLNIWRCEACAHTESVQSYDALAEKPGVEGLHVFEDARKNEPDLSEHFRVHKPYIDAVVYPCEQCSAPMRRVPEVLDCWFDSGAMPFAQWGAPAAGKDMFDKAFPADFISEAIDQTRGWFYSLLAIGTMLFDASPYKTCVVLGLVCDEKGFKMSKSKGNYLPPEEILSSQGADALRWYFLSANQPWTSVRFSDRNVAMAAKDFLIRLRNVYSFFRIYAGIDGFDPSDESGRRPVAERPALDRWILGELSSTVARMRAGFESYNAYAATQATTEFVESLSNWYLRRSRPRFWGPEMTADKSDAYWTLYEALVACSRMIAPCTPFLAEELHQTLVREPFGDSAPESVHLCRFPDANEFQADADLARGMALAREASALGRAARAEAKARVRTPLSEAIVVAPDARDADALEHLASVVEDELNVKRLVIAREDPPMVRFEMKPNFKLLGPKLGKRVKSLQKALAGIDGRKARAEMQAAGRISVEVEGEAVELTAEELDVRASAIEGYAAASGASLLVILNTEVTPELEAEGFARDLVSVIQGFRKELELPYEARVEIWVSMPAELKTRLAPHADYIMSETLSSALRLGDAGPGDAASLAAEIGAEEVVVYMKR